MRLIQRCKLAFLSADQERTLLHAEFTNYARIYSFMRWSKLRYFLRWTGFILVFCCYAAPILHAQEEPINHPELDWYTLRTDHFQVHFHEGAERTARIVAKVAEEIYEPITSLYNYRPDGAIHFIIKDYDDNSNGAAYYYDNKVEIWAPQMTFILRGTHDWLRNVVTHEFSHMISLGAARKLPRKIPAFYLQAFGYEPEKRDDVLYGYPNVIASYPVAMTSVPMWMAEGMAQIQTPGLQYDLWDSHRDMLIRTAVVAGEQLTYDEMGVFGKNSLGNERTYNSGYALIRYIVRQHGQEALQKLADGLSRPLAFTAESAIRAATGRGGEVLYREWQEEMGRYYRQRLAVIDSHRVEGEILTPKGMGNTFAAWSPDGRKLAYCGSESSDYLSMTHLWLYDTATGKKKLLKRGVSSQISWSRDSNSLFYARIERGRHGSRLSDLFRYDLQSGKEKQLTRRMRAFSPDLSPDGSTLLCAVQKDGTDNLVLLGSDGEHLRDLTAFSNGEGIMGPRWSPDGRHIVFSQARRHGRDLILLDADSGERTPLVADDGDARDPWFSADGQRLYFAWDKSGIFNIYSIRPDGGDLKLWTNTSGGAFMPSLSAEGELVWSQFQYNGYKIARLRAPQSLPEEYARYAPADNADRLGLTEPATPAELAALRDHDDTRLPDIKAEPYEMTYGQISFLPRAMIDYKTLKLGSYFYASDVLERYSIFGGATLNPQMDLDAFAIVEMRRFKPTLFLELYSFSRHIEREIDVIEDYPEKVNAGIRFNILEADLGARINLTEGQTLRGAFVHSRYTSKIGDFFFKGIDWVSPANTYYIGNQFIATWNLNAVVPGVTSDINPRMGRKAELRYSYERNRFFEDFATDNSYGTLQEVYARYNYHRVELNWHEYLPAPWASRHGLSANIHAGWIDRPVDSFFNFFAGGLPGLRGYPYYSIEGRKMILGRFAYRLPLLTGVQKQFLHLNGGNLYLGAFFDYGNAFDEDKIDPGDFKKTAGGSLRLNGFSFYGFPTALSFEAAYGFDRIENGGQSYGREWRYYLMALFDFMD